MINKQTNQKHYLNSENMKWPVKPLWTWAAWIEAACQNKRHRIPHSSVRAPYPGCVGFSTKWLITGLCPQKSIRDHQGIQNHVFCGSRRSNGLGIRRLAFESRVCHLPAGDFRATTNFVWSYIFSFIKCVITSLHQRLYCKY